MNYLLWCRPQMCYSGKVNNELKPSLYRAYQSLVLQTGFKVVFEFLGRCVILGAQCAFALTTMGH